MLRLRRASRNKQETITPIGSAERKQKPLSLCLKCVPAADPLLGQTHSKTMLADQRAPLALFAPAN